MKKIKLDYPIEVNGATCSELILRRVTVRDLEIMGQEKTQIAQSITLLSRLTDLAPDDIRNVDAADFDKASEVVEGFLG